MAHPCPIRFSAKATRGPAPDAHLFEPLHLTPCSPEVTVTSLHSSRLYRLAVFFIQTNVLPPPFFLRVSAQDELEGQILHWHVVVLTSFRLL